MFLYNSITCAHTNINNENKSKKKTSERINPMAYLVSASLVYFFHNYSEFDKNSEKILSSVYVVNPEQQGRKIKSAPNEVKTNKRQGRMLAQYYLWLYLGVIYDCMIGNDSKTKCT